MNRDIALPASDPPPFARRVGRLKPSTIREILKTTEAPEVISFAGGLPAPELFPVREIAGICEEVLALDGAAALQYGITEGYRPLREWLCEHLAATVGLHCTPDQILITHGSQQGLDLLGKVLLDPGDLVLVEDPSYVGALQAFGACEVEFLAVPVDDQGLCPEALREALRSSARRPKLLYTIPNFQNPTGLSIAASCREQIVRIAAEFGVTIVEDDPYGALRYSGAPAPALTGTAGGLGGVYLGTASKIMAPGLRVAWMVVPDASLYRALVAAKQATDLHTSSLTQRIVARYAESGRLESHVGELLPAYRRRRDAMLTALARHLPDGCDWTTPDGGLFLWVRVPEGLDTLDLFAEAMRRKVAFVPGGAFWVGKEVRNTLRLNFSNAAEDRIEEGIRGLGAAIRAVLDREVAVPLGIR
jgi:2-aminoadipate transaminase